MGLFPLSLPSSLSQLSLPSSLSQLSLLSSFTLFLFPPFLLLLFLKAFQFIYIRHRNKRNLGFGQDGGVGGHGV